MTDEEYARRWSEILQRHRGMSKLSGMNYELLKLVEQKYGYDIFGDQNEPQETD